MLVLSRNKDESIMIGDDIEITICDVRGDKVRLGINAPRSIDVYRREIYDKIQEEKKKEEERVPSMGIAPHTKPVVLIDYTIRDFLYWASWHDRPCGLSGSGPTEKAAKEDLISKTEVRTRKEKGKSNATN